MSAPDGIEVLGESLSRVPAAAIAAQRVAEVRDSPGRGWSFCGRRTRRVRVPRRCTCAIDAPRSRS